MMFLQWHPTFRWASRPRDHRYTSPKSLGSLVTDISNGILMDFHGRVRSDNGYLSDWLIFIETIVYFLERISWMWATVQIFIDIWRFPKIEVLPNHPFLDGIFHCKPSNYGGPPWLWKSPFMKSTSGLGKPSWFQVSGCQFHLIQFPSRTANPRIVRCDGHLRDRHLGVQLSYEVCMYIYIHIYIYTYTYIYV